ncbi:MAG: hypothetical protein WBS22_06980 [Methylocystis sp.]
MKNIPGQMKRRLAFASAAVLAMSFATASKADINVYELASENYLGKIDLTTGAFTQITPSSNPLGLSGLANYNGVLYGGAANGDGLYSVNPSTGLSTLVGNSSILGGYADTGSTTSGLYALGPDSYLYSINPNTGASTQIGDTNIPISGIIGMSANGGALYISQNSSLYQIDTSTGAATLVGTTSSARFGAMVDIGGVWYGGNFYNPPQIFTFDPTTAAVTPGAVVSGTSYPIWGLAPAPAPNPGAGLLGLGSLILAGAMTRVRGFLAR